MGVSMLVAMEVFTQPNDLMITITDPDDEEKIAFVISRGPGHRFKMLLSTVPIFESREAAIKAVESILHGICESSREAFMDPKSTWGDMFNPGQKPIDESAVLNEERLAKIMEDLQAGNSAITFENESA